MLTFETTKDPCSNEIKRDDIPVGFLQWHQARGEPRLQFHDKNAYITQAEMKQCLERLEAIKQRPAASSVTS